MGWCHSVREIQLDDLTAWCDGEQPIGVRLVSGGGSGKSRLGAEVCVRMAGHGWNAGFADTTAPESSKDETNVQLDTDSLIVVDDAEANVELVASLVEHLAYQETEAKTRILLLARHRGVWLETLQQQSPDLANYYRDEEAVELDTDLLSDGLREEHFQAAAQAFAARLRTDPSAGPVRPLSQPAFNAALLVHMNALLATVGEPYPAISESKDRDVRNRVLDRLVDHEKDRWDRSAPTALREDGATHIAKARRDGSAAVAILAAGATTEETATLLVAVPGLGDEDTRTTVAWWLRELYPGPQLLH